MNSYLDSMGRLREDLLRADYLATPVLEAIGEQGQRGLSRNHTIPASHALAGREDGLATLIRLFVLQQCQPAEQVARVLDVSSLLELGILTRSGDGFRAKMDVRPYEDETDQTSGWVVSDQAPGLDARDARPRPDYVLGISPASVSLSQITPRREVGRALDLGTGSGAQSLHLVRHAGQVVATDVNPRALTAATLTFALNEVDVATRLGSLYEPVEAETFDLITTNPPFVISPDLGPRLAYRETGHRSDDLMRAVVSGAGPLLNPGGSLHVVGNWAHVAREDWRERLAGWIPRGCDAFVVERELLDPYEYIEVWLADAGRRGGPGYVQDYEQWLAYFDALEIEAVGMGWITMVNTGSSSPRVVCESWPHPVRQPVATDLMAHVAAMEYTAWSEEQILDRPWVLAPGAVQEVTSPPGRPDEPTRIVLRRGDGLQRAIEVDAGVGGILGACDGELPLGRIIAAVAHVLDSDPMDLQTQTMPLLRSLISQTWLTPMATSYDETPAFARAAQLAKVMSAP